MAALIYLDYNATAPLHDAARTALIAALPLGNPSSFHGAGRSARAAIEKDRAALAKAVNAKPANVIFTAGATEANHLALKGLKAARILVSAIEHDAVLANALNATRIPVLPNGIVDLGALENMLQESPARTLVAIMAANNETGVIQPIADIAALCQQYGALLHVDAVQAFGRLPIDLAAWGADSIALSAHKAGGPKGIGCLIARDHLPLGAQIKGGGQEQNRRAGTENVPAIAGFGAVAAIINDLIARQDELRTLQTHLEQALADIAGVTIYGQNASRLTNTTLLTLDGAPSATQLMALDIAGFAVSSGSACSSGKVKPSHVLSAMGVTDDLASCALRISTGPGTTKDDIDLFIAVFRRMATSLTKDGV